MIACSSGPEERADSYEWMDDFVEVHRLDYEEADQRLKELAQTAPSEARAREAQFERARLALRADHIETARSRFEAIWEERTDDAPASRALYELGRIAAEHDGDEAEARRLLHKTIAETPPWVGAEFALQFLIRQEVGAGRAAQLADDLGAMAAELEDDRMAAQLYLERGLLLDEELGQPNEALKSYRSAFGRCKECSATDEAIFQMGKIYTRHQSWQAAIDSFAIIARRTSRSFFVGTYNSHRAADARYEAGMVEFLFRQDYDAAARHFKKYVKTFPNHRETDDAAWHLVQIERLRGSDRSYRRALERFVEDYPYSSLVDDARQQLADLS